MRRWLRTWWPGLALVAAFGMVVWYSLGGPDEPIPTFEDRQAARAYESRNDMCKSLRYLPQMLLDDKVAAACHGARQGDPGYTARAREFWRKWEETPP